MKGEEQVTSEDAFAEAPLPFSGAPMHDYFCRVAELGASTTMEPSSSPQHWECGEPLVLPVSYEFRGEQHTTEAFLTETDTAALLVIQHGKIRYEHYALTGGPTVPWMSMSVAKSVISALVGIAVDEGLIDGLETPMSDYVTTEPGSAYDGTPIRDVLQMSSGARWTEDYNDPDSDIFRLSAVLHGEGTFDDFIAGCVREFPSGTVCRYNSSDTQALASLLVRATGRTVTEYMSEKLFDPLGMTSPGYWLVDDIGREAVGYGLNMTARDYAKVGELYRNRGRWNGRQLVPADYVEISTSVSSDHTRPGHVRMSSEQWHIGYGYQWWLPEVDAGEFVAIGVYNQFIYVHPPSGSVIVKLSSNRAYGTGTDERTNRDLENIDLLRTIARSAA